MHSPPQWLAFRAQVCKARTLSPSHAPPRTHSSSWTYNTLPCVYHILFTHPLAYAHVSHFSTLVIVSSVAMDMPVHVYFNIQSQLFGLYSSSVPRKGLA